MGEEWREWARRGRSAEPSACAGPAAGATAERDGTKWPLCGCVRWSGESVCCDKYKLVDACRCSGRDRKRGVRGTFATNVIGRALLQPGTTGKVSTEAEGSQRKCKQDGLQASRRRARGCPWLPSCADRRQVLSVLTIVGARQVPKKRGKSDVSHSSTSTSTSTSIQP